MALAVQTQVSDGSLTKIQVGIDFIEQADIQVYFDLAASPLVAGSDYTWTASKTITFSSAVPAGTAAFLLRQTNVEEVLNVFDGGASFSRYTLDENFHQILLLAQEVREGVGLRGIFLPLDMHGYKIKNLGDPTVDTDAANLAAVKALCAKVTSGYQAADASLQAQLTGNVPLLASAFSPISWHGQTIENSVNIPANKNAWSFGPQMRIAEGQRVEIGEGSTWTIAEGDEQEGGIDLSQYLKVDTYTPAKAAQDARLDVLERGVLRLGNPSGSDDTSTLQAALNTLQGQGGGILELVGTWNFTTLNTNGTVSIRGVGVGRTTLIHNPANSTSDGIVYNPTGSFLRPYVRDLTFLCSGTGRYGIATPVNAAQFSSAFAIDIARISARRLNGASTGWSAVLRIGDVVTGSFRESEIRGGFDVSADPATQADTAGVIMEAASANIAFDIQGIQIVGTKYGVRIGENVEGFFVTDCEIVNCLDGVGSYNTTSKPGGYITSTHLNCARYPVYFQNRRDFTLSNLQMYRGSGHYNGSTAWVGIMLATCSRFSLGNQYYRVAAVYTSKSYAVQAATCTSFHTGDAVLAETGNITDGWLLTSCSDFVLGSSRVPSGMASWVALKSCSFGTVGQIQSPDAAVPTTAYDIDSSNNRRNIKVDRTACDRLGYDEITYTAAATKVINFSEGTPVRTFNLNAGAGAYTVDIQLVRANHLAGNKYLFRVVMGATANPTIRFLDDTTANVRRSITGTGTATIYEVELVYNNAGWVLSRVATLTA